MDLNNMLHGFQSFNADQSGATDLNAMLDGCKSFDADLSNLTSSAQQICPSCLVGVNPPLPTCVTGTSLLQLIYAAFEGFEFFNDDQCDALLCPQDVWCRGCKSLLSKYCSNVASRPNTRTRPAQFHQRATNLTLHANVIVSILNRYRFAVWKLDMFIFIDRNTVALTLKLVLNVQLWLVRDGTALIGLECP